MSSFGGFQGWMPGDAEDFLGENIVSPFYLRCSDEEK